MCCVRARAYVSVCVCAGVRACVRVCVRVCVFIHVVMYFICACVHGLLLNWPILVNMIKYAHIINTCFNMNHLGTFFFSFSLKI